MASKALLVFALLLVAAFLVAANDQTQAKEEESKQLRYGGYGGGGYGCKYGCCRRGSYGGCRCCVRPDEIPEPMYRPEVAKVHN